MLPRILLKIRELLHDILYDISLFRKQEMSWRAHKRLNCSGK